MAKTAIGESGGDGSVEVIWELLELAEERSTALGELERREAALVRRARQQGYSWQQIASALGVSKQAAHKKYGRR